MSCPVPCARNCDVSSVGVARPRLSGVRCGRVACIAVLFLLGGCAQVDYLLQSAQGHLTLLAARQPIAQLLNDPSISPELAQRLAQVNDIRAFARDELGLPDQGSYQDYVDLQRPHVLYSVSAAPPLSLTPRHWCYPIVGCVSYRGFFQLRRASDEAALFRAQGDDVYVAPVQAYSTLGWFDDPVISPLLRGPSWYTASVIFHELTHQELYIADDTAFNEAYAVAVQREGERRWLAAHGDTAQREQYARYHSTQQQFLSLVRSTRRELAVLYASPVDDAAKRLRKQALFMQMRARFVQLRSAWGGYRGFDRWFAQDLNNAKMALVATYNDLVPRFATLLAELGGDMPEFHRRVAQLARLPKQQRRDGLPR